LDILQCNLFLPLSSQSDRNILFQKVASWQLYSVVVALLAMDVLLLSLWAGINPMRLEPHKFPPEEAKDRDDDIMYEPLLEQCVSTNDTIWMGKCGNRPKVTVQKSSQLSCFKFPLLQNSQESFSPSRDSS
jgi:hypothetical protein